MKRPSDTPTVVLFQYRLFHYRVELFELLRKRLSIAGIRFELVYGDAFGKEKMKRDEGVLDWGQRVGNLYFPIKEKKDLCWQPLPRSIAHPDLVIFMQENRLLANYYWMLRGLLGHTRTAFWGHGQDFQSRAPGGIRERWKHATINAVDWWFAYTPITVEVLKKRGFPLERVTLLNNAIDIKGFCSDADEISDSRLAQLRAQLHIPRHARVGLFCGSIYPDKKPELLVQAADLIRAEAPDFHLVVIGDGQSADCIRAAALTRPWLHPVGARHGREKAACFRLAEFVLNPGSVGLHVLDAFALGLPMITTANALHGPEIHYLQHGVTGLVSSDRPAEYAGCALALLRDPQLAQRMRIACLAASAEYTVENMATRFANGIVQCMRTTKTRTTKLLRREGHHG